MKPTPDNPRKGTMYAPNAPDPRPSNAADYSADDLLGVMTKHRTPGEQAAILAGAFLDYARWLTDWSPPDFEEARPKQQPHVGTAAWRRKAGFSRGLR